MHLHVLMCMYSKGTVPKGGKPSEFYSLFSDILAGGKCQYPSSSSSSFLNEFLFNCRLVDENYEEKLSSNKMNTGFYKYKNHKSGQMRHTGPSSEALLLNSRTSLNPVGSDLKWNATDQSRYACVVVNYGLVIC